MMELATLKDACLTLKRPSWLLGFLLAFVLLSFLAFAAWQVWFVPTEAPYNFAPQQWVLSFAAVTAMSGWIIAALINIRNSIKQHTISALLQSRLSSVYMEHASKVGTHYSAYAKAQARGGDLAGRKPTDGIDETSLQYILNYFEFISLGIRTGDLHEGMLRDSLLTIVKQNVAMSREWIEACRKPSPRLYMNLAWLHAKWCPNERQIK